MNKKIIYFVFIFNIFIFFVLSGKDINSPENDHAPMVTRDGKYLFFSSTRNKISKAPNEHNIFWLKADIIVKLKNKRIKKEN